MTTNNHPAHGPVSLDRLHQISEILSKAAAQSDGGNLGYAMADAVKVIDGAIAEFEEQDNPRPVMAVKGELGFIDNLEKIIEERDEDIDIGQLGRSNYDALMLAALDAFRASPPVVPSEMNPIIEDGEIIAYERHGERFSTIVGSAWNACRAAMLQAEPVSNRDELPLDYLQGQKDGLEWAAQLAEANHPQTGDWLYDDPIELARAIRKGPDMPEFKSVSVDEDDNFYSWFGRFWYENYQKNNYTTSAKQMLGTMAEFAYRAGRESAALAGNSPVTPEGWIPVSERMPEREAEVQVYCADKKEQMVGYLERNETEGWFRFASLPNGGGVYCKPTHWMPLPAEPKQEVKL